MNQQIQDYIKKSKTADMINGQIKIGLIFLTIIIIGVGIYWYLNNENNLDIMSQKKETQTQNRITQNLPKAENIKQNENQNQPLSQNAGTDNQQSSPQSSSIPDDTSQKTNTEYNQQNENQNQPQSQDTNTDNQQLNPEPITNNIDYNEFLKATVKIKCDIKSGLHYYGSGFVISGNRVVTVAHVLYQAIGDSCEIIFPDNNRTPQYTVIANIGDRSKILQTYEVELKDVAVMQLPPIENYPSIASMFNNKYPYISIPICDSSVRINDKVLFYGYPYENYNSNYLANTSGYVYGYLRPISGVKSGDEYIIDSNITKDEVSNYPSLLSKYIDVTSKTDSPVKEGYSGGLAVDETKKCILGPISGYKEDQNIMTSSATWLFQTKEVVQ